MGFFGFFGGEKPAPEPEINASPEKTAESVKKTEAETKEKRSLKSYFSDFVGGIVEIYDQYKESRANKKTEADETARRSFEVQTKLQALILEDARRKKSAELNRAKKQLPSANADIWQQPVLTNYSVQLVEYLKDSSEQLQARGFNRAAESRAAEAKFYQEKYSLSQKELKDQNLKNIYTLLENLHKRKLEHEQRLAGVSSENIKRQIQKNISEINTKINTIEKKLSATKERYLNEQVNDLVGTITLFNEVAIRLPREAKPDTEQEEIAV